MRWKPRSLIARMIDTKADNAYGPFGSTSRTAGPKRFEEEQELAQTERMDEEEEQRSGYAPAEAADEDESEE